MTPDGISDDDWNRVRELACEVANHSEDETLSVAYTDALLLVLDELEKKYGRLPSLLATRADYVPSLDDGIELLEQAYDLALKRDDVANLSYISDTLADIYIRTLKNVSGGRRWLAALKQCMDRFGDQDDIESFLAMKEELEELERLDEV